MREEGTTGSTPLVCRFRRLALPLAGVCAALLLLTAPAGADPSPVAVANAGVLASLVNGLKTAVPGVAITNTTGGSVALAQGIGSGSIVADLFGSADASVNHLLIGDPNGDKERWYAAFARNAIVLEYSPSPADPHNADFVKASQGLEPWYQPLITGPPIKLCRMSPDADPSGYYTLFVMQLAEKLYGIPGLDQQVLGDDRNPAQTSGCSASAANLQSGAIDANFTYLSGAVSSGLPFLVLPPEVNLSDPAQADAYATATFTNAAGQTFHGGVIRPSIAPIDGSANPDAAHQVLLYLFANKDSLLSQYGLLPSDLYAGGDPTAIPADLRPYFDLRRLQVTVKLNNFPFNVVDNGCATDRLQVSGDGVTVSSAVRVPGPWLSDLLQGPTCQIGLDVATGQTGLRDLTLTNKAFTGFPFPRGLGGRTFPGVVDLSQAVPVVPSFLQQ